MRTLRGLGRRWVAETPLPVPRRARIAALIGPGNPNAVFIAPDLSFAYVSVPKAANSTIKRALLALRGIDVGDEAAMQSMRAVEDPYLRLGQLGSRDARRVLAGAGVFRFTFVRNPYDRMVSAYKDKVLGLNRNHPGGFAANLFASAAEPPSLGDYVRAYTALDDYRSDIHWRSQYANALIGVVSYDLIGHVESFDADFARVLETIAPGADPAALVRPTNISPAGSVRYTDDLAALVYRRYERDFTTFGYERGSYLGKAY